EDLHVEMPHVLGAPGSLPAGGKGLRQQRLKRFALGQPFAVFWRQRPQLVVAEAAYLLFQLVDLGQEQAGNDGGRGAGSRGTEVAETADVAFIAGAEQAQQELADVVRKRGQAVAQLLPKTDIHRRFTTH